jgi:hypothetical protein
MHTNINATDLNNIDLSKYASFIIEDEFRDYYLGEAGSEHYRLLAHLSNQYTDSALLDIGTYKGCSSLALAHNPKNLVKSFDIRSGLRSISDYPDNIEYIVDDITESKYLDLISSSPLILLDTDHDGIFEQKFYLHLKSINWSGLLLLDDINYNDPMRDFWNSITEEKYDITHIGHHSGTGLVIFK